jgi:hypothetical protein
MRVKSLLQAFVFLLSIAAIAQPTAYTPPNMTAQFCGQLQFNLTLQTPIVLGNQTGTLTVGYFQSQADAIANQNPIENPVTYTAIPMQTIFARVTDTSDSSFALTSFMLLCSEPLVMISQPTSPPITRTCIGATLTLNVVATGTNLQYKWIHQPGTGPYEIPGATSPTLELPITSLSDNGFYQCQVYNQFCAYMSDAAYVQVDSPLTFQQTPQDAVVCAGESHSFDVAPTGWPNNIVATFQWYHNNVAIPFATNASYYLWSADFLDEGEYKCVISNGCGSVAVTADLQVTLQCAENSISGEAKYDVDNNGCSETDVAAANIPISRTWAGNTSVAYTNSQGRYAHVGVESGENMLAPVNLPAVFDVVAPTSRIYGMTPGAIISDADFCISASSPLTDASVYIHANNQAVPGFAVSYTLYVANNGTTTLGGNVSLAYDATKLDFVSTIPGFATHAGNVLTFDVDNLQVFGTRSYRIDFMVKQPPTVNSGDSLVFAAAMEVPTDAHPEDNQAYLNQIVVNSFDPNEISVQQGAFIQPEQVDDYLIYTIHFQNTGTAAATFVRLENILDYDLDWDTFRPVASNYQYFAERSANRVTFRFNNINLPASSQDEMASNGYVTYRIKPKQDLMLGDVIWNKADIYFDFNAPIETNTVTTQLAALSINKAEKGMFVMSPNPANEKVVLTFGDLQTGNTKVSVSDIQGKTILTKQMISGTKALELDVSGLQSGMYFVKVVSGNVSATRKLIVE